ncbi:Phenol hydroxylase [Pseudocercospora fuligena]|uniref:Phenol hydroxylase n=1 Tax=Pseudocercospora fuligena TaxID=685502 RepID=A0A8H6VML2_9PEZI|nr:Phenol hydroxylase [Pseudocercospora fuligena]
MSTGTKREVPNGAHKEDTKIQKLDHRMSPGVLRNGSGNESSDVVVVGAGPAGLMLACNLVRFGIKTTIIDDRPDKTSTGRADGLQPKTIETLKQMRLADDLLKYGVKFYDICFWSSTPDVPLRRTGRDLAYPPEVVDLLDPYMILNHQGSVEEVFLKDLESRGVEVLRSSAFVSAQEALGQDRALTISYQNRINGRVEELRADFLVGCDGAHSQVRKSIPGAVAEGASSDALWGVLDGEVDSNFPDLWSKTIVQSHKYGSILFIPRERNLTRLYIELKSEDGRGISKAEATQEYVLEAARRILHPYKLDFTMVEWFGAYQIGQRVTSRFSDDSQRMFLAGDASHTHSPKAAQGMNTSMHDSLNLAWKLNLAIRGLAKPDLLATYQQERRQIAQDLIDFDYEHANAFHDGDPEALAQNFTKNVRFISGFGVEYSENIINQSGGKTSNIRPGSLLPPAKVTRYIDANPLDIQLDIPMLGQFKTYFLCPDLAKSMAFLRGACDGVSNSLTSQQADPSFAKKPRTTCEIDEYHRPERYTAVSQLFTLALVTATPKADFELSDLPTPLDKSKWTVYLDDIPEKSTNGKSCLEKWIGGMTDAEVAVVNVRPDGYVGSVRRFDVGSGGEGGLAAASWLSDYYSAFLVA